MHGHPRRGFNPEPPQGGGGRWAGGCSIPPPGSTGFNHMAGEVVIHQLTPVHPMHVIFLLIVIFRKFRKYGNCIRPCPPPPANLRELCHRELLKSPAYHQRLRVQLREAVGRLHRLAQEIVQDADVTPQLMRASVTPEQAERRGTASQLLSIPFVGGGEGMGRYSSSWEPFVETYVLSAKPGPMPWTHNICICVCLCVCHQM